MTLFSPIDRLCHDRSECHGQRHHDRHPHHDRRARTSARHRRPPPPSGLTRSRRRRRVPRPLASSRAAVRANGRHHRDLAARSRRRSTFPIGQWRVTVDLVRDRTRARRPGRRRSSSSAAAGPAAHAQHPRRRQPRDAQGHRRRRDRAAHRQRAGDGRAAAQRHGDQRDLRAHRQRRRASQLTLDGTGHRPSLGTDGEDGSWIVKTRPGPGTDASTLLSMSRRRAG